jgi:hypothetical protein
MSVDLTPVITATTHWLVRTYPAAAGPLSTALAESQARQAVMLAAWLRYPTSLDVELLDMSGPGGTARLDGLLGTEALAGDEADRVEEPWRSWVDEVLASWAVSLLAVPELARTAAERAVLSDHACAAPTEFRRLVEPDENDLTAASLLRHPDLTSEVAELHRTELMSVLSSDDDDDLRERASAPAS